MSSAMRDGAPLVRADAGHKHRRGPWTALALATLGHALGSFAVLSVAPLTPFLVDALHLSRAEVGWFLPAVYLGGVLMSVPAGWLTDHIGVRGTLAVGLAVIGVMVAVSATTRTLAPLLACLVLAGFGFSVLNPATGKAIVDWFPPRRRGAAMGIKQTGLTLGGIAASLVLPRIAHAVDWRAALFTAAAIALACASAIAIVYRSPAVVGVPRPAEHPRLADIGQFLRRPGVVVVFVCGFALSVAQSSFLGYLALYAKETFLVSAIGAGQLLALGQIGGTAGRLGWGFVSDRYFGSRRRPGIVINTVIGALAFALLALGRALPWWSIAPIALVAGVGAFGWVGLYFALVAEIGGRYAGLLTGMAVMFSWSGVLVGPPLFGLVLEATGGYRASWLALVAVALAVAAALPWPKPLVHRAPATPTRGLAGASDAGDDRAARE